jgi:hypothetical protein
LFERHVDACLRSELEQLTLLDHRRYLSPV